MDRVVCPRHAGRDIPEQLEALAGQDDLPIHAVVADLE